ncbi:Hypothetical Protein FCC1311_013132 [Hondaea fermentalgiana]|uniref:Uncharacterized protein n=1 Tax=Hondaea fermentalgiana TaxID=2315210 RepID=A0A2R5G257_9STRA|nr:Hypothetical Protein FCC1311_013132 [Hondaea fermentalgiana]|eukprot:GBG25096.1 Hypothetical Protein FCC1311_013132 [Hondaea fermentalgiana]
MGARELRQSVVALASLAWAVDALAVGDVDDLWIRQDKFLHVAACAGIVLAASCLAPRKDILWVALALFIAVIKEIYDGPRASLRDFVADCVGILVGLEAARLRHASKDAHESNLF